MPLLPFLDAPASDLVTFTVKVNGSVMPPSVQISSITVNREVNRIPFATLKILDGDPAEQTFEVSSDESFIPGNEIEIQVGFHSDEETIFKGIVVKHALRLRENRSPTLEVECKAEAIKMTTTPRSAFYRDVADSDIFSDLLAKYSLSGDVTNTTVNHTEIVQHHATDWDFMLMRAEANGQVVGVEDEQVVIKSPAEAENSNLSFEYGRTIYEFEGEMDARNQLHSTLSESWDYANQEIIEGESDEPNIVSAGNLDGATLAESLGTDPFELSHSGKVEDAELKAWADAKLLKSRLAKIRGRVRVEGSHGVMPNQIINLGGLGARFNGDYYVSGVRHEVSDGSWFTDIQLGLSPEWFQQIFDLKVEKAANLLPGISGLQVGVVSQLENDPAGEDRILIKIPVINPDDEGIWCRTALLDAGENRGTFFRPEIGDEVIVGFINDDPRDGVILGALHSSAKPAPISATDDNHIKGIYTRSEMKLEFDDDKSSITLESPGGNKVLIDDDSGTIVLEDLNGNKIEMSSNGIVIESAAALELKATTDFKVEGVNLTQKAQASFKAEGSAGAELSSSGQTVVKGSIVMIN
jgi:Rhs element Vgr protein